MNLKELIRRSSAGSLFFVSVLVAGCGGGSSGSGAGSRSAAESPDQTPPAGEILLDVPTPITQDGNYVLPVVDSLTDIDLLNCPNADADARASSATLDRVSAMACNGGPTNSANFPAGGGILTVNLNSGNAISVQVRRALSLITSNK